MVSRTYLNYLMRLRQKVSRKKDGRLEFLLASYLLGEQKKDIEVRTKIIDDFFRVKVNVKAFNDPDFNFSNNEDVFGALRNEFDMPYWAFHKLKKIPLFDYNDTFIYQLKTCNLHCPYCYVDDFNKNAKEDSFSRFFSISEIVDVFEKERKKQKLHNLRPSGGEPTLVIEQWPLILEELSKRKLENVFVQGDTNLTTGHFIDFLEENGYIKKHILERVAEHKNFGLLCSLKGTDAESFSKNTGTKPELFEEYLYTFKKIVESGIDAYPFLYNPNPNTLEPFLERLARQYGDSIYLKTWVFKLKLYGPEKARLMKIGEDPKEYQKKLYENFEKSKEIMQNLIWKKFHLNYQAIPRTGIELKVKN